MATSFDVDLSDLIVSVARGVSEANAVLNKDPAVSMAISTFEVNATFTALIRLPIWTKPAPRFQLAPSQAGGYRVVVSAKPNPPGASLRVVQPAFHELFIPSTNTESMRLQIRAVLEAVVSASVSQ